MGRMKAVLFCWMLDVIHKNITQTESIAYKTMCILALTVG